MRRALFGLAALASIAFSRTVSSPSM